MVNPKKKTNALAHLYSWRFIIGPLTTKSSIHINVLDEIPEPANMAGTRMQIRILQSAINTRVNKQMFTCYREENDVVGPIL